MDLIYSRLIEMVKTARAERRPGFFPLRLSLEIIYPKRTRCPSIQLVETEATY